MAKKGPFGVLESYVAVYVVGAIIVFWIVQPYLEGLIALALLIGVLVLVRKILEASNERK